MSSKKHECPIAWLVIVILAGIWFSSAAQDATQPPTDTQRDVLVTLLCHMSGQLRLIRPLATYAILSPIRNDQRLYAQYIVNILEGSQGKDYVQLPARTDLVQMMNAWGISVGNPGLIDGMRRMADVLQKIPNDSLLEPSLDRFRYATKNISILLDKALDEARASLRSRTIDAASEHMCLVYACALGALGTVGMGANPGSVTDLLVLLKGSPACREQP